MKKWLGRALVVVAVVGGCVVVLGAAGMLWLSHHLHRDNSASSAKTNARIIRTAIQQWQAVHDELVCPTIDQLVREKQLDPGSPAADPWNQPYRLQCTDDDVTVRSAGVDKQFETADDIVVPKVKR
jgi:type II secretory pathway pseudopilin PulG